MRNNKGKWPFVTIPARNKLSPRDVIYWKNTLSKVLKVGLEFEFNLTEKPNGTCRGDNDVCPCGKLSLNNKCWQQCLNTANCGGPEECPGIACSSFVSACYACEDYKKECASCEFLYDPRKNPDHIRSLMSDELMPSKSYGQVNDSGVYNIMTDGSLLGKKGAEIITIGRRINYWEFLQMSGNIIETAKKHGGYFNERCSIHMHVLASYYGKVVPNPEKLSIPASISELERDMPEIILANLHQLVRRYQNAMTWMTMGLDDPKHMTRWEKFRVSILPITAITHHMQEVKSRVSNNAGGNKYGWINYNNISFSRTGDVKRFHVEFRAADALMSPSAVAAIACMYYALVIKAVEISRYGVVEMEDELWFSRAQEVKDAMLNNMKDYRDGDRFGDTRNLHKYYDVLIEESLDLVHQLKAILIGVGPAYEVLEKLAERPVALRRCDGNSWEEIENNLKVLLTEEGQMELAITEIVNLNQVSQCNDLSEWVDAVSAILREEQVIDLVDDDDELKAIILTFVKRNMDEGRAVWSSKIGSPIMI